MQTGIIILAAGASTRLGKPKQLLVFKGNTLLQLAAEAAMAANVGPIVVVVGAHSNAILPHIHQLPIAIVYNEQWQQGMGSSIGAGMKKMCELYPTITSVLLMLCDQPFADATLLRKMVQLQADTGKGIVACTYGQTAGVPALFTNKYFAELKQLKGHDGAKTILLQQAEDLALLPFPQGVVDIDTMQDYQALTDD